MAFSPDGLTLASGSYDAPVKLWRVSDGALIRTLIGHTSGVLSVAFSPDGQTLASGSRDDTIKLWRVSDGEPLGTYDEETGPYASSVTFSPDGSHLAWGRDDATVVVSRNPFAPAAGSTVFEAKTLPVGSRIRLADLAVSATFGDCFYAQAADRSSGIRVAMAAHGFSVGARVSVVGSVEASIDGERFVNATYVDVLGSGVPQPVALTCRAVGGGPVGVPPNHQQGIAGGQGLNNIGLLVKVSGKVTFVDPGGQFFTITDGSAVKDADGHDGVRVWAPGLALPGIGEFATVTGISSCYKPGEVLYPRVLVRTASDIVQVF